MEFKCKNCQAPLLKSYGETYKLRSRLTLWNGLHDKAITQCRFCRSFNEIPLKLKITSEDITLEIPNTIKKSQPKEKEKLIIQDKPKNDKKERKKLT